MGKSMALKLLIENRGVSVFFLGCVGALKICKMVAVLYSLCTSKRRQGYVVYCSFIYLQKLHLLFFGK